MLLQKFLPKLKTCVINKVNIANDDVEAYNDEFFALGNDDCPLETLKVDCAACGVYKFLAGCQQLKSMECRHNQRITRVKLAPLSSFLNRQSELKKLDFVKTGLDLSHMTCFQLEELTLRHQEESWVKPRVKDVISPHDESIEVAKFLEKLPNLMTLDIEILGFDCRRLMEAICNAPLLENLSVRWIHEYL